MATTTTTPPGKRTEPGRGSLRETLGGLDWRRDVIYIGFAIVFLFFAILLGGQGFLSANNLLNIFRQTATVTVVAVAMTFVIASAEIDLSVGSVAGLSSVCAAMAVSNYGVIAGIIAGLLVGAVVGAVNGGLVSMLGIPSFLVTLGMLGIAVGLPQWITNSAPQPILSDAFNLLFGSGNLGPIPGLLIWTALFVAGGAIALSKTRFGRQVLATGGNRMAADFTGVNTKRIKFQVLLLSGLVAGIVGMLYAGRPQSGRFQWGPGDELPAIGGLLDAGPLPPGRFQWGTGDELPAVAAVIVGGTSLFGGSGSVIGPLF